jgi:hypothetical protein
VRRWMGRQRNTLGVAYYRPGNWREALAIPVLTVLAGGAIWFLDPWHWRLKEDPPAALHWRQAQKAIAERDFDEARKHLLKYLEELPFNAEAHFVMARASRRSLDFRGWRQHPKKRQGTESPLFYTPEFY